MAQQVELAAALAGLNAAVTGLRQNLDKTAHYNPGLRPALEAASNDMGTAAEQFTTMVNDDILAERYQMLPAVYFAVTTRVIEKGYNCLLYTSLRADAGAQPLAADQLRRRHPRPRTCRPCRAHPDPARRSPAAVRRLRS